MDRQDRISAGELRAMGFGLDPQIPDCATVRRAAIHIQSVAPNVVTNLIDQTTRTVRLSATVEISEPFSWIRLDIPVGA